MKELCQLYISLKRIHMLLWKLVLCITTKNLRLYLNLHCSLCNYTHVALLLTYKLALPPFQNSGPATSEDDVNASVVSVRERAHHLNRMESESELQKMTEAQCVKSQRSVKICFNSFVFKISFDFQFLFKFSQSMLIYFCGLIKFNLSSWNYLLIKDYISTEVWVFFNLHTFFCCSFFIVSLLLTIISYRGCQGMLLGKFSVFCMQFQIEENVDFLI